jgi:hypothetical protein
MIIYGRCDMKKLFTAIALAGLIATPAFAATSHHQTAPSTRQLYLYAPNGPDLGRAAAMQECNAAAAKWSNGAWQSTQLATYGTCMTEHGQMP